MRLLMTWSSVAVVLAALILLPGCQSEQAKLREQGIGLYHQGNYGGALAKFNAALKYDEFDAVNHYYAGMAAFRDEKYEQAAFHLKLAWQADPSLPEIKQALTETLVRTDHVKEALDYLDRDTKLVQDIKDPRGERNDKRRYLWEKEERMYLTKGQNRAYVAATYARLGDLDNARLYFEEAIRLAPKDANIWKSYGDMYAKAGRNDAAATLYARAYALEPKTEGLVEAMTRIGMPVSAAIQK